MWNVKQYSTWQAITLVDVSLSRGHSLRYCCYAVLLPLTRLLTDISLEFRPSVAGSLWLCLDRNSIWVSASMNELEERDTGRRNKWKKRRVREWDNSFRSDTKVETDFKMTPEDTGNRFCSGVVAKSGKMVYSCQCLLISIYMHNILFHS